MTATHPRREGLDLLDGGEAGACDFVWDVAAPLPLMVIADLLGFGEDVHDDLLRWSDDMLRATSASAPRQVLETAAAAMVGFRDLQLRVIAARRSDPRDDLISTLCTAEIDGHRLDDESIVNETLLLRWVSPVKNMSRTVTTDVEMRGQHLREGDEVMLFYPSANREAVFAAPDTFDVRRHPNPHLAFGFGPHHCLGASLARLELEVMFREVLPRMPDLEPAPGGDLPVRPSNFVSGLEAMPVRFTRTPATATSTP